MKVAVDSSRSRSGGARAHLEGVTIRCPQSRAHIQSLVWHPWDIGEPPQLSGMSLNKPKLIHASIFGEIHWQACFLERELEAIEADVLFSTDAATFCQFQPNVVLSQDMLSYEPGIRQLYGLSRARLRLEVIRHVQNRAMRRAEAVIFLTKYARDVITEATGPLKRTEIIPHGIDTRFFVDAFEQSQSRYGDHSEIKLLYVSNTAPYKNHLPLIDAVARLRGERVNLALSLVGPVEGATGKLVKARIRDVDPMQSFIRTLGPIDNARLPQVYCEHDICVFASGCENLPITLLEGMASGLPIACSNRGPMPEVLQDGGIYFDPSSPDSIARALKELIENSGLRAALSHRARELATPFTWERCAKQTWELLIDVAKSYKK